MCQDDLHKARERRYQCARSRQNQRRPTEIRPTSRAMNPAIARVLVGPLPARLPAICGWSARRFALGALSRRRGARYATGQDSRANFADDQRVSSYAVGLLDPLVSPLVRADIGWDRAGSRPDSRASLPCAGSRRLRGGIVGGPSR